MPRTALVLGSACACAGFALAACLVSIDDSLIGRGASDAGDAGAASDALNISDAMDGGDAVADARLDATDAACPSGMVQIPAPGDAGAPYCIDSTEVTITAYAAFLAKPPAASAQITECTWNTSFTPANWVDGATSDRPVTEFDWCDAYAYCTWAGKRLCGAIGGGRVDPSGGATTAAESQWFNACTHGGARMYPYGATYDAAACLGADSVPTPSGPEPVGQAANCVGGYDGLFDMSGNAEEFLDSCSSEKLCDGGHECELCVLIGGGFHDDGKDLDCAYVNYVTRNGQYDDNGIRCCWP